MKYKNIVEELFVDMYVIHYHISIKFFSGLL